MNIVNHIIDTMFNNDRKISYLANKATLGILLGMTKDSVITEFTTATEGGNFTPKYVTNNILTLFPHEHQLNAKDCVLVCIKIIAKYYNRYYSLQYLRNLLGKRKVYFSLFETLTKRISNDR